MAEVFNDNIYILHRRLNRFMFELAKDQSANVSDVTVYLQERIKSYIAELRNYLTWIEEHGGVLDLPESHPVAIPLDPDPVIPPIENEMVLEFVMMLKRAKVEMINSNSARYPSGIISHDRKRFQAVIDRMDEFLSSYVTKITPVDQPESTPRIKDTGEGRKGINPIATA